MINKFISLVERLTYIHFLLLTVLCSELFTFVLNILMSLLWYEEVSFDLLIIGIVDSLIVSFVVAILFISMVRYNARIRFEKNVYEKEITERKKYEEQLKIANQGMEQEISERVGTEIRLKHALSLLKSTLESTADGLLVVNLKGKIVSYNHKFMEMWNIQRDLLDSDDDESAQSYLLSQLKDPEIFLKRVQSLYESPEEESFDVIEFKDGRVFERYSIPQRLDEKAVGRVFSFRDVTKRVRAEETIRQSTSLIDKTFSSLDVIVLLVDTSTNKILKASQAIEKILGYRIDEVVGRDVGFLHVSREMREEFDKKMFRALDSTGQYTAEFRMRHKSGRILFTDHTVSEVLDDSGERIAVVSVIRDVTERKVADEALRESEVRYRTFVETAPFGIQISDRKGVIVYSNREHHRILGYEEDELVGKYVWDFMGSSEERESLRRHYETVMGEYQSPSVVSNRNRTRDGRIINVQINWDYMYDKEGNIAGAYTIISDITEREKAEEARKESEELFYEIFRQNEDALIMFEPETFNVIDANPAAERLFKYSREELVNGKAVLFHTNEYLELAGNMDRVDRSWMLAVDRKKYMRKGGTSVTVSLRGKVMKLKESDVLFCSFRDMTENIRLEEEAKLRQAYLIQTNKMTALGTLVSGVAHEINNPNAYILANTSLLHKAWRDISRILEKYHESSGDFSLGGIPYSEMREAIPQLIAGIDDGSRRIKNIVGNLKHFARKDREGLSGMVDVNSVIVDAVSILNNQIHAHTDNLAITFGEKLPQVRGSSQQLEQVIINLIMNALQALPDRNCKVSISTYVDADGDTVGVEVTDEGIGMTEDVLERVTEPFFTTKFDSGGTGLGLSISYSILKEHNAQFHLRSRPGEGTTVKITLPAYREVLR